MTGEIDTNYTSRQTNFPSGFIDLTNAKAPALLQLERDVIVTGGEVDVLVHPFTQQPDDPYPLTAEYETSVAQFIEEGQANARPLIVFEEIGRVDTLPKTLSIENPVYVIQTLDTDPVPACSFFFRGEYVYRYPSREERNVVMVALLNELKNVGVRQATVGGRYLVNREATITQQEQKRFETFATYTKGTTSAAEWVDKGLVPDGCVGITIYGLLRNGVEVALSPAASPTNRVELTSKPQ